MFQKFFKKKAGLCSAADADEHQACIDDGLPVNKELHLQEKEEFFRLLHDTGCSIDQIQHAIVDEFLTMEGHISPEYLADRLNSKGEAVTERDVQFVLDLLCRYGIAQKVLFNGKGPWYEHLHIGQQHDHQLCVRCGKIEELQDGHIQVHATQAARNAGFRPVAHRCIIYGVCQDCLARQSATMPLSMVCPGERVKVVAFHGGGQIRKRLQDMGLVAGEEVEVLNRGGPVIVSVKGSRIALGMGLAQKVMVESVDDAAVHLCACQDDDLQENPD